MALVGFLLQATCAIFIAGAALSLAYCWVFAIFGLAKQKQTQRTHVGKRHTFIILIPAHNEEVVLGNTIESLKKLDYPQDKYQVIVVADNCTDETARIAREHGAECLIRNDPRNKGKGQALSWAFEKVLEKHFDAVVILDADCQLDSNALRVFDSYLGAGWKVFQAKYSASNPDSSAMSYALAVGNLIENDLFYAPKSRMGLAVLLRGTGFVISPKILKALPWRAHSVAEDIEYSIDLIRSRIPIGFVPEVRVFSEFPVNPGQLEVQRTRWAEGNIGFAKKNILTFVWQGLRTKNWLLIDAGLTLFVLSKPMMLLLTVGAVVLSIHCRLFVPGMPSQAMLAAGLILSGAMLAYLGLGILRLGLSRHRLFLLIQTPLVVYKLVTIALKSFAGRGEGRWVRTPR